MSATATALTTAETANRRTADRGTCSVEAITPLFRLLGCPPVTAGGPRARAEVKGRSSGADVWLVVGRGQWQRAALVGGVVGALLLTAAPADAADPVAKARAQARAAAADVRALQAKVSAAEAAYQSSLDGLSSAVTSQVLAERIADQASQSSQAANREQRRHLQQLYLTAGPSVLGLFLTDGPVAAAQSNDYLARIVAQD